MTYCSFYWMNRGTVGKLQVKDTQHWRGVDDNYWETVGIPVHIGPYQHYWWRSKVSKYTVYNSMVRFQHKLVDAARCGDNNMILIGGLHNWRPSKYHTPWHPDLLENWGKHFLRVSLVYVMFIYLFLFLLC